MKINWFFIIALTGFSALLGIGLVATGTPANIPFGITLACFTSMLGYALNQPRPERTAMVGTTSTKGPEWMDITLYGCYPISSKTIPISEDPFQRPSNESSSGTIQDPPTSPPESTN